MSKRVMPQKNSVRGALMILACGFAVAGADAQTSKPEPAAKVEQIDVTDYGIYTADKTARLVDASGLAHHTVNNIQYIAETSTIPAQTGIKFGFRYTIAGTPYDAKVTIKQVTIYPPAGVTSPKTGLLYTNSFSTTYRIGMPPIFAGYDIDSPWEVVPGVWTIQLWIGDRKLAEQSFTVVSKGDATPPPLTQ
ncbi:MAG TPA: DUF3859 domain-containing protein [Rhizomicrobium sp.]|nr:DUF3859 domain-containing protein [Rhizomicrobium sp.]